MPWVFNPFTGKLDQTAAAGGGSQVNSDWNSTSGVSQILNKPTIPAAQVNSDWNSTSGVSQILNKPSLFSGAYSALTEIPSTFAPSAHTHPATDVTGLAAVATSGSASNLGAGTLALARLDPLVAIDNINNNFTAGQTITAQANTSALTASYSVTGANTTPLLDLSGTWNTTGIARGLLLNVTDTASAATSLLLSLQVGGASRLSVAKNGAIYLNSSTPNFSIENPSANGVILFRGNNSSNYAGVNSSGFIVSSGSAYQWTSGASITTSVADLSLARDAANTLAQRNGTNAQTTRIYGTYTDASNGRRLDITSTTGGVFTLTATGNGTGSAGNILKLTAPVLIPAASVTLATNGDLAFEATSNTSLTIRYRGTDGTTRSASLTLA